MLQIKNVYNRIGWFFCLLEGIMILMQVLFAVLGFLLKIDFANDANFIFIMSAISYYVVAFPIFALCMSTLEETSPKRKSLLSVGSFWKLFFISFALMNATNFLNVGFYEIFEQFTGHKMEGNLDGLLSDISFLMILTTVVLAPIFEELTFRYFTLNKLRKFGDKTAILISAALFGLFHMNFEQAIYAFAIGLVFGYVACKTGNVIYTIGLHALVNFCGGVVPLLVEHFDNKIVEIVYSGLFFIFFIAGIVILLRNVKKIKFVPSEMELEQPVASFFTSPGMLVFVITCIIVMLLSFAGQVITAFS